MVDGWKITTEERIGLLNEELKEAEKKETVEKGEALNLENSIREFEKLEKAQFDSAEAAEAFRNHMNSMGEQYPQLIESMDASGNAIIDTVAAEQMLAEARYEAAKAALETAEVEYNLKEQEAKRVQEAQEIAQQDILVSDYDYDSFLENDDDLQDFFGLELNKKQASGGTPYLLTAAIPSTSWGAGTDRFDFKTLNKYVDYINMMSYDLNNPDKTTHVASAYSSSNDKGFGFSCDYGVNLFTSRGLDKSKIILGVAGYGKAYKVTDDTSSSKYPLLGCSAKLTALDGIPGSFASGTVFLNGVEVLIKSGKYKQITEYNSSGKIVGSYLYNEAEKIFVTYDSKEAIIAKYEYAKANEGMGIMCWAYTEDTADSYVNSIYDNLE
jgi:hypothetical protein